MGNALSGLGKAAGPGLIEKARELGVKLPPQLDDPNVELTGELIVEVLRDISWHFFPGAGSSWRGALILERGSWLALGILAAAD